MAQPSRSLVQPVGSAGAAGSEFHQHSPTPGAIDAFIAVYNPQAVPFEWAQREVRSVEPKHKYAYFNN